MKMKKLISFDVSSYTASFRQISGNSSVVTYPIPPRTTIAGMIGAILGIDDYFDFLSKEKAKIGLHQLSGPYEVITHGLGYSKDFNGIVGIEFIQNKHGVLHGFMKQTRTALVPAEHMVHTEKKGKIAYRIFFSHKDERVTEELLSKLENNESHYSPSLGKAKHLVTLSNPRLVEVREQTGAPVETQMPIMISDIEGFEFETNMVKGNQLIKVRLPEEMYFSEENNERLLKRTSDYYVEKNGKPFSIIPKSEYLVDADSKMGVFFL